MCDFTLTIRGSDENYSLYKLSFNEMLNNFDYFEPSNTYYFFDKNVYNLYKDLWNEIQFVDKDYRLILIDSGEESKSFLNVIKYIERVASVCNKNTKLVAVGGGVVQDIVGFVASIIHRGLEWIYIPTTLAAMADSCIGGKTSINWVDRKNIIGTYSNPKEIFVCLNFLKTLNHDQIQDGLGEILHYLLIRGEYRRWDFSSQKLFDECQKCDFGGVWGLILESLLTKQKIIELDEKNKQGLRDIFNYGHTFGHAYESYTDFKVSHGYAVGVGMRLANLIAYEMEKISEQQYKLYEERLSEFTPENIKNIDKYISYLKCDKKNEDNKNLTCILLGEHSCVWCRRANKVQISYDQIKCYVEDFNESMEEYSNS